MTRGCRGPKANSIPTIIRVMTSQLIDTNVIATAMPTVAIEIGVDHRPIVA